MFKKRAALRAMSLSVLMATAAHAGSRTTPPPGWQLPANAAFPNSVPIAGLGPNTVQRIQLTNGNPGLLGVNSAGNGWLATPISNTAWGVLTVTGGSNFVDILTPGSVGGGFNDLITVNGTLNLGSSTAFRINQFDDNVPITAGDEYPIVRYSDTLTGSLTPIVSAGFRGSFALVNHPGIGGGSLTIIQSSPPAGGTMHFEELHINPGGTASFDLTGNSTIGAGVNDLIQTNGTLQLSGGSLVVNSTDLTTTGTTYRLMEGAVLNTDTIDNIIINGRNAVNPNVESDLVALPASIALPTTPIPEPAIGAGVMFIGAALLARRSRVRQATLSRISAAGAILLCSFVGLSNASAGTKFVVPPGGVQLPASAAYPNSSPIPGLGPVSLSSNGGTFLGTIQLGGTGTVNLISGTGTINPSNSLNNFGSLVFSELHIGGSGFVTNNYGTLLSSGARLTFSSPITSSGMHQGNLVTAGAQTINLSGSQDLSGSTQTVTVGSGFGQIVLAGTLSNGSMTKSGPGTFSITGTNTGSTVLSGSGTLVLTNVNNGTLGTFGNLEISQGRVIPSGSSFGSGTIVLSGSGSITISEEVGTVLNLNENPVPESAAPVDVGSLELGTPFQAVDELPVVDPPMIDAPALPASISIQNSPVPEPAILGSMLFCGAVLLRRARRK